VAGATFQFIAALSEQFSTCSADATRQFDAFCLTFGDLIAEIVG